jgi:RecB family exonuclease
MIKESSMSLIFEEILNDIKGLDPKATLVLGSGFVREEWKTLCFKRGFTLTGSSIQNILQIASELVPESNGRVLEVQARVELLRKAFLSEELRTALPLLSRHRARPFYFEKLDQTLQSGRLNFAHSEEAEVIFSQLVEKTGNLKKREEFFLLNRYWESLLSVRGFWDDARLFENAVHALASSEFSSRLYYRIEHSREKPRVEWFWSELAKKNTVKKISSSELFLKGNYFSRVRTHSLEDSAHFLMDEMTNDLENQVVVIQDLPVIRRTLKRVAEQRGIFLQDSRDPTLVTQSEAIKQVLLDLELCAKGFSRTSVLEWLRYFHPKTKEYRKKLIDSAVVQGLQSYQSIPDLHAELKKIQTLYPSRLTLEQLKNSVIESIRMHELPYWTKQVMENLFEEWERSLELIGLHLAKNPLRYWYEKLQNKLKSVNPVIDPVKNRTGLRLHRVDQCPSLLLDTQKTRVHFFGIENSYFEPRETQGEWFSVRDQEILASEFGWVSVTEKSAQNRFSFDLWNFNRQTVFWEFDYDENGHETESFDYTLGDHEHNPLSHLGAHPRLISSWSGVASVSPDVVKLPLPNKDPQKKEAWPFSFVHAYGNCPFVAYSQHLLRLQDERDVEVELAADRFGTLLHSALEEVVKNPDSIERAFEIAWEKTPPTAWEKNERWYQATRAQVIEILECFISDEAAYRERSQVDLLYSEKEVEFSLAGLPLRGRIDRIDDHEDGLVVIDYKTGGGHSGGQKTLESGKDFQLGLYALAAREVFQKEVITAQYVHLDPKKINRNSGFLFSHWNKGKKADEVKRPISTARSNSNSLFTEEPEQIWLPLKAKAENIAQSILAGEFSAKPADPLDCARCRFQGVCGENRR